MGLSPAMNPIELKKQIASMPWAVEASKIVTRALHLCRSPAEAVVAFNGGKDCTALLYLVLADWAVKFPNTPLTALYIVDNPDEVFPEITEFVSQTAQQLPLELVEISRLSTPAALAELLRMRPEVRFVFMGTRRTDPHGNQLEAFTPTDISWPAVMRVNPILHWKYSETWKFLKQIQAPVCSLYERGYTSLGDKSTTLQNPSLGDRHASELENSDDERAGRIRRK